MKQYHNLAKYYDLLVKDDESTKLWVDLFEANKRGNDVLELASGTGEISIALTKKDYDIVATDISNEMLDILKSKCDSVNTFVLDMKSFKLNNTYNNIICFCDSVNYLTSLDNLKMMFNCVFDNLSSKGVFIFDAHDERRIDEFKEPFIEEGILNSIPYQWTILSEGNQIHQHFVFYEDYILEEYHVQTVFKHEDIVNLLVETGFEVKWIQDFGIEVLEERKCYIATKKLSQ